MSHMRRMYKIVRQSRESVIALKYRGMLSLVPEVVKSLHLNHKQHYELSVHCFLETEVISVVTIEQHCQTTTKSISSRLAFAPS